MQKSINATDDQLFPAPGKSSEMDFHLEHLEMGTGGQGWERYVPRILPPSLPHHLFSKAIPEVQHSGETGKEIQLNFPPIEESGPRENGSSSQQLFQIPPFAAIFRTGLARRLVADELKLLIPLARTQTENFEIYCQNWTFCRLVRICTTIPKRRKQREKENYAEL